MLTIIEAIEIDVPQGYWCHGYIKSQDRVGWCKYHQRHKPKLNQFGQIESHFCDLSEEYVNRKECGFNEKY